MKRTLIAIALFIATMTTASAETAIQRDGKTFVATKQESQPKKTGFTYKDTDGKTYEIYIAKTGSCYIIKTSKKSGNDYRKYLGEEISRQICKELNVTYQPKSK